MRTTLILFCLLSLASQASACIWDYDTLRDEQRGLPGVLEIITGRFEKRSAFFYQDRIAKMRTLLQTDPNNQPAIDNLAVALFRTGRKDEATATLVDKEKRFPDQYTTSSNLATFYMLSGDHTAAIPLLEKALRINPNAHFGREEYQLKLARFLAKGPSTQEAEKENDFLGHQLSLRQVPNLAEEEKELTAVIGMIRFGTDQSPDLYYALGNLLSRRGHRNLSAYAYFKADEFYHPIAKDLVDRRPAESNAAKADFAAGAAWAKAYMDFSDDLIRAGKDPEDDSLYADFYRQHGRQIPPLGFYWWDWVPNWLRAMDAMTAMILAFAAAAILWLYQRSVKRRRLTKAAG